MILQKTGTPIYGVHSPFLGGPQCAGSFPHVPGCPSTLAAHTAYGELSSYNYQVYPSIWWGSAQILGYPCIETVTGLEPKWLGTKSYGPTEDLPPNAHFETDLSVFSTNTYTQKRPARPPVTPQLGTGTH